jgi:hypothetical protein
MVCEQALDEEVMEEWKKMQLTIRRSRRTWLKELVEASATICRHSSGSTAASQVTTPSMVAMLG